MDSQISPFLKPLSIPVSIPDSVKLCVIFAYVLAMFIPWFTSIPLSIVILINIVVFGCGLHQLFFNQYTKTIGDIDLINLNNTNQWRVVLKNKEVEEAEMGDNHYVHHLITILHLRWRNGNWYFIFTKENISANAFRYLRTRLLHPVNVNASET